MSGNMCWSGYPGRITAQATSAHLLYSSLLLNLSFSSHSFFLRSSSLSLCSAASTLARSLSSLFASRFALSSSVSRWNAFPSWWSAETPSARCRRDLFRRCDGVGVGRSTAGAGEERGRGGELRAESFYRGLDGFVVGTEAGLAAARARAISPTKLQDQRVMKEREDTQKTIEPNHHKAKGQWPKEPEKPIAPRAATSPSTKSTKHTK
jgi:hypothetical protein